MNPTLLKFLAHRYCEIVSGCSFKSLNWWQLVTAEIESQYSMWFASLHVPIIGEIAFSKNES